MEMLDIVSFLTGPAAAVVVALYLNKMFVNFMSNSIEKIIQEAKEDRKLFQQAIEKLDRRLEIIENEIKRG
jgi:uncharacterized membrane protein